MTLTPSGRRMASWVRRIVARLFGPRIVEPEIRMACAKIGISMDRYGRCMSMGDFEPLRRRVERKHNRLAGLLGHYFLIGPSEALAIIARRDIPKISEAWAAYSRYKSLVICGVSFSSAARIMRISACTKAKMLGAFRGRTR